MAMSTRSLVLLATLALNPAAVIAADFNRTCQDRGPYPPKADDCNGFADMLGQKYPQGTIRQSQAASSCQHIYQKGSCIIDYCAFPGQSISVSDFRAGVLNILNNCKTDSNTGGYVSVKGTNTTIGVYSNTITTKLHCYGEASNGAVLDDCSTALNNIQKVDTVVQQNDSGCTTIQVVGTCSMYYCDRKGAQLSGLEVYNLAGGPLFACTDIGSLSTAGYASLNSNVRVGYARSYNATATNAPPQCRSASGTGITQRFIQNGIDGIQRTYPNGVRQTQANGDCTTISTPGDGRIDFCGPTGSAVFTFQVTDALKVINSTCAPSKDGMITASARINGTSNTIAVTTNIFPKNVWCNPASNNSPTTSECDNLFNSIDKTKIYSANNQGCAELVRNGNCKVDICAAANIKISGDTLLDSFSSVEFGCRDGDYVSGVQQLTKNISVAVYR